MEEVGLANVSESSLCRGIPRGRRETYDENVLDTPSASVHGPEKDFAIPLSHTPAGRLYYFPVGLMLGWSS